MHFKIACRCVFLACTGMNPIIGAWCTNVTLIGSVVDNAGDHIIKDDLSAKLLDMAFDAEKPNTLRFLQLMMSAYENKM